MATLIEVSKLLDSTGDLYHKVRGGVIKSAASVYAEADTTLNHAARLNWARDVLLIGNVEGRTREMYRMCLTNAQIVAAGNAASESDVEWCLSFFLDTVANGGV